VSGLAVAPELLLSIGLDSRMCGALNTNQRAHEVIELIMMKKWRMLAFALLTLLALGSATGRESVFSDRINFRDLPAEAQATVRLIQRGGPFPFPRDGAVFANHEGVLPKQKRGYYHEFTVKTPRARNRGARRIVVGGNLASPSDFYYTDDHYTTFRRIFE
jgi:ribonuclease T1